jgi:uncharacterized damage-inducible protein DinB
MSARTGSTSAVLLHALDEAFGNPAWHGPSLRAALRGVSAKEASRRPVAGRHSIREIVLHVAYWKNRVRQRLTGDARGSFPIRGTNWFWRPAAASEKEWREERRLLEREHGALRRAVAAFPQARLRQPLPGARRRTALREITGIALHDVYHTGQIQLLKALHGRGRSR